MTLYCKTKTEHFRFLGPLGSLGGPGIGTNRISLIKFLATILLKRWYDSFRFGPHMGSVDVVIKKIEKNLDISFNIQSQSYGHQINHLIQGVFLLVPPLFSLYASTPLKLDKFFSITLGLCLFFTGTPLILDKFLCWDSVH